MNQNRAKILLCTLGIVVVGLCILAYTYGRKFTITFKSDGEVLGTITVNSKDKLEKPEDPVMDGYEFVEWQKDGKAYDFDQEVTESFTLEAKWSSTMEDIIFHVVFFDSNGGSEVTEQYVLSNEQVLQPTDPVRDGYEFVGWYYGDSIFEFPKRVSQDMTLVAHWKKK